MFARTLRLAATARFCLFGVALLIGITGPATVGRAAPAESGDAARLAERVPADAIVYVGWRGADGLGPAYEQSRLKAVFDATDGAQFMDPFLPNLIDRIEKEDKDAGNAIRMAYKIGKPMWKHPSAFFFEGIDWHGDKDMPTPHLALLCQAGDDAGALERELTEALDEGMKQAPAPVRGLVKVVRKDDLVAIVIGEHEGMFPGIGAKSLANDSAFNSGLSHINKDPVAIGFVNVERLARVIDTGVESQGDADVKKMWPKLRDASGIAGVSSAVWGCGFDGKEWVEQAFVAAPSPRKGLVQLMDEQPIAEEAVQLIPRTATLAGVANCDTSRCLEVLRSFVGNVDADARQQLDALLKQASETSGVNVEQDLLKGLGNQWVYYTDPRTGGRGIMGLVLINRLNDPAKAEQALTGLEKYASSLIAEQTKNQHMTVSFLTTKSGELTIHYLGLPLVSPSWTIHDGSLYVALFPQVVVSATDHVGGKSKSILDNPDFAALRTRMGIENATAFQFMDLPRTAPDAYPQWLMVSRISGFGDLFGVPSPAMLAPPLSRLLPQLTAAGSATWVDNDGLHVKAISPFPGSTALATDPFGGFMGMQPLFYAAAAAPMRVVPDPRIEEPKIEKLKIEEPKNEEPKIPDIRIPKVEPPDAQPAPKGT